MKKLKSYEQFLNESSQDNIVNVILDALEPTILEMVNETEAWYEAKFKQDFTDFDREMTRLNLIFDMVKAVETYTQPTDSLLSINVTTSVKGNIEITAQIQRGIDTYSFSTEAIYAGGHNIQRLHYRYITKTGIPKTGASTISKEYSDKIKRMSKAEKLNAEIKQYEARVTKAQEDIAINSKLTDDAIIQVLKDKKDWYEWPTWKEIVKRDAAKNYNNDEAYYNQEMEDGIASSIESWKRTNITWKEQSIVAWSKEITKLQNKLEDFI
jgi:hypothetical protein